MIGIAKAYCTRVGSGPFPTEQDNAVGEKLRQIGHEFGSTTGRSRRCGWIDIPQLKYTIMLNGVTQVIITKLDVLNDFDEIQVGLKYIANGELTEEMPFDIVSNPVDVKYEMHKGWNSDLSGIDQFSELPPVAQAYINELEGLLETRISIISTGPERSELIVK